MSKRRIQCTKCPWRKDVNPRDIPGGYCEQKHMNLKKTIARPGDLGGIGQTIQAMACHESKKGNELHCVGWLHNQLNEGNNIALRYRVIMRDKHLANYQVIGEQHTRFEDTLPDSEGWADEETDTEGWY